jgi:hypothetical protein
MQHLARMATTPQPMGKAGRAPRYQSCIPHPGLEAHINNNDMVNHRAQMVLPAKIGRWLDQISTAERTLHCRIDPQKRRVIYTYRFFHQWHVVFPVESQYIHMYGSSRDVEGVYMSFLKP